ncbi:hypothetical protein NM208_g3311 [Fusarium decemcellulare]|uniref:Uncharacterized protein n=1 Tax=Fusarium decemcellulare TaxID=57161 RepID=A0ACC1SPP2_9HYPO|nr:hypothetical protein NM208_g3311 [Fusarium decemcellulare]
MDPASLTFGVVSLAMQLMQTTAAIKKLIAAYKSAAKELSALSDKLDDVEIVCSSLEMVLDNFDGAKNSFEIALLNKLHKVISDCHTKVSKIYELLSKIMHSQKQSPLRTIGALFLKYREQINRCIDDLDRSLSSLQLHMTTNILQVSNPT